MRTERRRTRKSLTRALERIAGRIAAAPTQVMEWDDRRTYVRESATISAQRLWVAGSYARGAQLCGDLDLIVELTIKGRHPPIRTIGNQLFGRAQDTSLYVGTPEQNSSNIAFPDARLVWSETSSDWRTNISGIALDPDAGHFDRPADRLPLRPDQLTTTFGQIEHVLALIKERILSSEFVDAATIPNNSAAPATIRIRSDRYNTRTADALRLATTCLAPRSGSTHFRREEQGYLRFYLGGTLLLVGRPELPVHRLDTPFHNALALVPHKSRRGPNGIWIIRRGPEHPLEKAYNNLVAFYVTRNGQPDFQSTSISINAVISINLYSEEQAAFQQIDDDREFYPDGERLEVARASGARLLEILAGCDLVFVDSEAVVLSHIGERVFLPSGDDDAFTQDASALVAAMREMIRDTP